MRIWCSIFCATADRAAVIAGVRDFLTSTGYTAYDPFDLIPGASYPITVKAFVAPPAEGTRWMWTRIILSEAVPGLKAALEPIAPTYLLNSADYTSDDTTQPSIETQLRGVSLPVGTPVSPANLVGVKLSDLPDDVQAMAGGIDLKNAGAMADKILGTLGGRLGASDADAAAARAMLVPQSIDWSKGTGAWLSDQAAFLELPPNWRTPDFVTLRDAYAVHKRLQWSPKAKLYEGDADVRDAVPNALDYTPIFAGKHA